MSDDPEYIVKRKGGPKPKFALWMCDKIIEIASEGGHIPAMRLAIGGISKDTWYRWQSEYPEFKEAVEYAETVSQVFYENIGLRGISGELKGFNAAAYMHLMANKFKNDYSRGSSSDKTEINVTNNTINLSQDQIKQRIAQRVEQLQSLGINLNNDD